MPFPGAGAGLGNFHHAGVASLWPVFTAER